MRVTEPVVVHERLDAHAAEIEIVVPQDLAFCKGHFPGLPVVPGVVQVKWAIDLARRRLGVTGRFAGCESLKFHRVLTPGDRATLRLEYVEAAGKLTFSFESAGGRCSTGRVLVGERR